MCHDSWFECLHSGRKFYRKVGTILACYVLVLLLGYPGLVADRFDRLFTAEDLERLTPAEIEAKINQAIYFSANAQSASVSQGDLVDVAFTPQINEYRGMKSVQMNLQDIRPHCDAPCLYQTAGYRALQENTLDKEWAEELLPERSTLATVWRYLAASPEGVIQEEPMCLCRKIVRWWGQGLSLAQLLICLDIFRDVGLLETENHRKYMTIRLCPGSGKADLNESATMQRLIAAKES